MALTIKTNFGIQYKIHILQLKGYSKKESFYFMLYNKLYRIFDKKLPDSLLVLKYQNVNQIKK